MFLFNFLSLYFIEKNVLTWKKQKINIWSCSFQQQKLVEFK